MIGKAPLRRGFLCPQFVETINAIIASNRAPSQNNSSDQSFVDSTWEMHQVQVFDFGMKCKFNSIIGVYI